jgi:hypothetical protein
MLHRRFAWFVCAGSLLVAARAGAVPCPNIMFVLDRSGSMDETPNGSIGHPTKWELLQTAVKNTVTMYGDQVPFGMEMFTSSAIDDVTCYSDTHIDVEPAHGTAAKITQLVLANKPDSGTNTGEAIKRAAVDPAMHDNSRGEYIVLITDGDPNCNTGDQLGSANYTISQIMAAGSQSPSIHTFVIGFDGSGGVNPANLNSMAKAGLSPQMYKDSMGNLTVACDGTATKPCYYSASNATAFNDAVNSILNIALGGEFGTAMCDDSCYANGCQAGYVCQTDELNMMPHCVPDPCQGITTCAPGDYCRQGQCVHACPACAVGQICQDGNCVADPCYMVSCAGTDVCDPTSGQCVINPCVNVMCKSPTFCDVSTGTCKDDQCRIITCPQGYTCKAGGNCESTGAPSMNPTGGGGNGRAAGCSVGHLGVRGATAVPVALASLVAAVVVLLLRRRRS